MIIKKEYVLGFLFDDKRELVALIEKQKPDWQKGYLNGVGGKVELTDGCDMNMEATMRHAMVREFREETGADTRASDWRRFAVMKGNDWIVDCFTQCDSDALSKVITTTNEQVHIINVSEITKHKTLSNVPWLVAMALDENMNNQHFLAEIRYF